MSKLDGALSPDEEESFHGTVPTTKTILEEKGKEEKRNLPTTDIDQEQGEFYQNSIVGALKLTHAFSNLYQNNYNSLQGNGATTEKAAEAPNKNLRLFEIIHIVSNHIQSCKALSQDEGIESTSLHCPDKSHFMNSKTH